jgi:hypothetical protein
MSRYIRLPSDQTDPLPHLLPSSPSSSSPISNRRPPASAFRLFASLLSTSDGGSSNGSNDDDGNDSGYTTTAGMLASLKESASIAAGGLRDNMSKASGSVRAGLGMPVPSNDDGADNDNSDAESQSSRMLEEVSEYCPTLTYQQVRKERCGRDIEGIDGWSVAFF